MAGTAQRSVDFAVLNRECAFGQGFMRGLADHSFSMNLSSASLGHAGLGSTVFFFTEPSEDLYCAVGTCTVVDSETAVHGRRPAIVDGVLADCGLIG